jgi:hypothetical protein
MAGGVIPTLENVISLLRWTGQGHTSKGKLELARQGVEGEQGTRGPLGL